MRYSRLSEPIRLPTSMHPTSQSLTEHIYIYSQATGEQGVLNILYDLAKPLVPVVTAFRFTLQF